MAPKYKFKFNGPIVIIGCGSIGCGLLPLLSRHIESTYDKPIIVIDPSTNNRHVAERFGADFKQLALTKDNFSKILENIIGHDKPRGMVINLANEVSSKDMADFASSHNAHYIDTVIEPWPGFYFDKNKPISDKTNYALREDFLSLRNKYRDTPTAISCCGANPGMVSWLVKSALLSLARETKLDFKKPKTRNEWALLMKNLGIKGIHIAERDTQNRLTEKSNNEFVNTWSVDGFIAEALQPAELGWGTHEKTLPTDGHTHDSGCKSSIYLDSPGGKTKVHTWTPNSGHHLGFLITHNEAISISDYYTMTNDYGQIIYRPTCHYAYHPISDAVASVNELFNKRNGLIQDKKSILSAEEIVSGSDQLGVLLFGNKDYSIWYGSTLSIDQARTLAPHQNATGLQVTSAILAGFIYCLNHPNNGIIETDEMEHEECLQIQAPYLGDLSAHYTKWRPKPVNDSDPWQFANIRAA
jgi:homospermidine synthase